MSLVWHEKLQKDSDLSGTKH